MKRTGETNKSFRIFDAMGDFQNGYQTSIINITFTIIIIIINMFVIIIIFFFNVNENPTRCNSMQIFIYCKATLHVSGVTAPIIRSTKNSNRSLRYRS